MHVLLLYVQRLLMALVTSHILVSGQWIQPVQLVKPAQTLTVFNTRFLGTRWGWGSETL